MRIAANHNEVFEEASVLTSVERGQLASTALITELPLPHSSTLR